MDKEKITKEIAINAWEKACRVAEIPSYFIQNNTYECTIMVDTGVMKDEFVELQLSKSPYDVKEDKKKYNLRIVFSGTICYKEFDIEEEEAQEMFDLFQKEDFKLRKKTIDKLTKKGESILEKFLTLDI
jgi:hypothetical protein